MQIQLYLHSMAITLLTGQRTRIMDLRDVLNVLDIDPSKPMPNIADLLLCEYVLTSVTVVSSKL